MRSFVAPPPERPIFAGPPPSFSVVIPAYQARRRYLLVQLAGLGAATALLSILRLARGPRPNHRLCVDHPGRDAGHVHGQSRLDL
jgi:hypothetical protein